VSGTAQPAISELLANWSEGDQAALRAVVALLYNDLRRAAHQYLRKARPYHTLQSTVLVHEAYLRLEKYGSGRDGISCVVGLSGPARRSVPHI
jgi:hypothetical protein